MTREALDKFRARVPAAQKMQDGDFMDWRVEFTYLNNFVNVVADYRCVCVCVCVCVCMWRVEVTYLNNLITVVADYRCDNEGSSKP